MFNNNLRAALLGAGAAIALMAGPALAGETDDLKAQIDALQSRLDQLERQQATAAAKPAIAPADAVVGGDYPGSFKLPGSDTSYSIHGFTKLDVIMDLDQVTSAQSNFFPSGFTADNVPAGNQGFRTNLFAHQSRLIFESRTPTEYGQLLTHIEGDFQGTLGGTDSVLPDNKGGFRIRNVWGQLGPVRAGNDDQLLTDPEAAIEHVTFFDPNGPNFFERSVQIRYTQAYGKFTFAAGLEMPGGESGTPSVSNNVQQLFNSNTGTSVTNQQIETPNITGGVQYHDPWGHVMVGGRIRQIRLDNGGGGDVGGTDFDVDKLTYLGQVSGDVKLGYFLPALGKDRIMYVANWGTGDAGSQKAIDNRESATLINFGTPGQRFFTNPVWGVAGGGQHWWTANLRSNFRYGYSKMHLSHDIGANVNPLAAEQTTDTQTFLGDLIWSPIPQVNFGLEYLYGERHGLSNATGYTGRGTDNRIQIGLQYFF